MTRQNDAGSLEERQAVQDVLLRYTRCIDEKDFETFRTCFHPEVVLCGFTPEPVHGVDAWVSFVQETIQPFRRTQHLLGAPWAVVSGDSARLRADLQALHFYHEPAGRVFEVVGVYQSRLVRRDGQWLLHRHDLDIISRSTTDIPTE